MLKFTDDLHAVAEAFKRGEVAAEDLLMHLEPRLEYVPEKEARRLANEVELAIYSLREPARQLRILEILDEAARVVASYPPPENDEA